MRYDESRFGRKDFPTFTLECCSVTSSQEYMRLRITIPDSEFAYSGFRSAVK